MTETGSDTQLAGVADPSEVMAEVEAERYRISVEEAVVRATAPSDDDAGNHMNTP